MAPKTDAFWFSLEMALPAKKAAPPLDTYKRSRVRHDTMINHSMVLPMAHTCSMMGELALAAASKAALTVDVVVQLTAGMAARARPSVCGTQCVQLSADA